MSKYAPGDKVRVIGNKGHYFDIGDIVVLLERDPECDSENGLAWDCQGHKFVQSLYESEFELVEKEKPITTYKTGDKVRIIAKDGRLGTHGFRIGSVVTLLNRDEYWEDFAGCGNVWGAKEDASNEYAYWCVNENEIEPIEKEKPMTNTKVPFNISSSTITVLLDGKPIVIPSSSGRQFDLLKEELMKPTHDIEKIREVADKTTVVKKAASGLVEVRDGMVLYKGEAVHSALTTKLLSLVDEGFDATPWMKFLENLMQNPSYRSRECLYNFLEKFQAPFTEDGCFIAFKRVRSDFKDIHSGKFDNSPGKVVKVDRSQVDDDPKNTCSSGLHVAADSYLDHYASAQNSKTVVVKVNPKDVVAVPYDYDFAKMRVCEYTVLNEVASSDIRAEAVKTMADTTVKPLRDSKGRFLSKG